MTPLAALAVLYPDVAKRDIEALLAEMSMDRAAIALGVSKRTLQRIRKYLDNRLTGEP